MKRARQAGFGLLEAVLAIAVLGAGMLSLWSTVTRSQVQARSLQHSMLASALLRDLAARVHMHRDAFPDSATRLYTHRLGAALPLARACTQTCNATEWAQQDLSEWGQAVAAQLPQGQFAITPSGTDQDLLAVLLTWQAAPQDTPAQVDTGLARLICPAQQHCRLVHLRR